MAALDEESLAGWHCGSSLFLVHYGAGAQPRPRPRTPHLSSRYLLQRSTAQFDLSNSCWSTRLPITKQSVIQPYAQGFLRQSPMLTLIGDHARYCKGPISRAGIYLQVSPVLKRDDRTNYSTLVLNALVETSSERISNVYTILL